MVGRVLKLLPGFLLAALFAFPARSLAVDARFDLLGPKIDVKVTRVVNGQSETLPIASVPNLQPGDKLWIHPDLPPSQSVKYLLICAFLRGTTNPPPEDWFHRIETWKKESREEGVLITVPAEAQEAVLFLAPETGGDFSTLKSAVTGRPGVFVRASQDLAEAGFEQARIEKYLSSMRRVPPSDTDSLQHHSDLLARTLALKPNADCFKRSVDTQFTCLTQTGTQTLLDDGHGQTIASMLSNGPNSDLIQAASYTGLGGAGLYSAYVGAVVDLVRVMANLHTAQYSYIPAIAFPQGTAMNLRLNTPPSFHNPKSVLVIGLPAIRAATPPPLRPADAKEVTCLIKPSVVLPIEGAPLVFSTDLAHDLRLHIATKPGAPPVADIPLVADAFQGGLVLQRNFTPRVPLRTAIQAAAPPPSSGVGIGAAKPVSPSNQGKAAPEESSDAAEPTLTTGTILGSWGFDTFTGPTVQLQQRPGSDWHLVTGEHSDATPEIIAGHTGEVLLASTGTACVHTVSAEPAGDGGPLPVKFKPEDNATPGSLLALSLPGGEAAHPGDLHLSIQQYGQPKADVLSTRTFGKPAHIQSVELHAGDPFLSLTGSDLQEVDGLSLGDLLFKPATTADPAGAEAASSLLRLSLAKDAPLPPTHAGDKLNASVHLRDGRTLSIPVVVAPGRPVVTLLSKTVEPSMGTGITLTRQDDLPLSSHLTFTLKLKGSFPRDTQVEVQTVDGTLRSVLTLAPSGGLLLQDPHTLVASLDPLRSFGPSAFGALRVRAVFPARGTAGIAPPASADTPADKTTAERSPAGESAGGAANPAPFAVSDWLSLGTLVRLPVLSHLQCPTDASQPCTLNGSNLFLVDSVAAEPSFGAPAPVPDGFTGTTLPVPHISGTTFFLRLRDDPEAVNSVTVPISTVSATASTAHHTTHTP